MILGDPARPAYHYRMIDDETAHALMRELEAAANALTDEDTGALLRRAAARLHQLETSEFAAAKMRKLLDEIAIELKGEPPPGGHQWADLPGLVRKLMAIRPPPTPHAPDGSRGGDDADRRRRRGS